MPMRERRVVQPNKAEAVDRTRETLQNSGGEE